MSKTEFAIITASFAPDFERCALLVRSIQEYISPASRHYLIVDQRDLPLFRELSGPGVEIMTVESVLPGWIRRLPGSNRWWLSLKTPPVRNWILQQSVKLAIGRLIPEDVLVFVDSDVTFIRPCSLNQFVKDGQVRLFRIPDEGRIPSQYAWHQTAARLLGLPPRDYFGARFIGNAISWRRDNIIKLHDHIERVSGRSWMETVLRQWRLSEYILYGAFVDHVLGDDSGHYRDTHNLCHEYWNSVPMSDEQLGEFFANVRPNQAAVMISARANMPAQQYERFCLQDARPPGQQPVSGTAGLPASQGPLDSHPRQ